MFITTLHHYCLVPLLFSITTLHITLVAGLQLRFESPGSGSASGSGPRAELLSPNADSSLSPVDNSSLVWQPLRATFRPLNRQSAPPPPPQPLALVSSEPLDSASDLSSRFTAAAAALAANERSGPPPPTTTSPPPAPTSAAPLSSSDSEDEDLPTRVPLSRFRPTRAPSIDTQSQPAASNLFGSNSGGAAISNGNGNSGSISGSSRTSLGGNQQNSTVYRITNECFECICEASTSCNLNSRCQTSDVRHTRCGMFLISYDQWLDTGLSKQLVTREALARDPAADERAFYECVTGRDCAQRLIEIYMQKNAKDCDKDGRIDCYDVAAIHQGGIDQCNGDNLLESQYWSDFNACFGFGAR